jgi:5-methylcytosine-specific restriction endonuclease McrA
MKMEDALRCEYCGVTAEQSGWGFEIDHFLPRSAGGSNSVLNLVRACHRCNQAKSHRVFKTMDDARRWLHEKFWTSKRKRYEDHRKVAFGGKPPESWR